MLIFLCNLQYLLGDYVKLNNILIDLSRDKEADDLEERNTTHISVQKNRPCSEEGFAGMMRFNTETFTLREVI